MKKTFFFAVVFTAAIFSNTTVFAFDETPIAVTDPAAGVAAPVADKHNTQKISCVHKKKYKTSPVRLSVLGGMSDRDSSHSYYYFTVPPRVNRVIGLDYGVLATKVTSVAGLQLSFVSIADYAAGVQAGLVSSFAEEEMTGVQIGGIFSGSEEMTGLQVAGIVAFSQDLTGIGIGGLFIGNESVSGLQTSALITFCERINGIQFAGLAGGASELKGIQIGGFGAYAMEMSGIQLAGVVAAGSVKGITIAPLRFFAVQDGVGGNTGVTISAINFGGDYFGNDYMVNGIELGALNIGGGNIKGVQLGAINHADYMNGLQIGIINYASRLNGVQIGAINICPEAKIPVLPVVNFKF